MPVPDGFLSMPSLRLFTISVLVALGLVGGLAWAALTTGEVLGQGSEDVAVGLIHIAPPSEPAAAPVESALAKDQPPTSPSATLEPRAGTTRASRSKTTKPAIVKRAAQAKPPSSSPVRKPDAVPSTASAARVSSPSTKSGKVNRWLSKRLLTARRDAPLCDGVHVYIVSAFENPSDSVATLALDPKKRGRQRRVGQRLGPYEVIAIGYSPSHVSSAVWLAREGKVCQALMRDVNPIREKALQRQVRRAAKTRAARARAAKKARQKKTKKAKRRRRR